MNKFFIFSILFLITNVAIAGTICEKDSISSRQIMPTWVFAPKYEVASSRYQNSKDSARNFFSNTSKQYNNEKNYQQKDLIRRTEQMQRQNSNNKRNYSSNQNNNSSIINKTSR